MNNKKGYVELKEFNIVLYIVLLGILGIFTIAYVGAQCSEVPSDYIIYDDFENVSSAYNLSLWTPQSGGTYARETTIVANGSSSLKIDKVTSASYILSEQHDLTSLENIITLESQIYLTHLASGAYPAYVRGGATYSAYYGENDANFWQQKAVEIGRAHV